MSRAADIMVTGSRENAVLSGLLLFPLYSTFIQCSGQVFIFSFSFPGNTQHTQLRVRFSNLPGASCIIKLTGLTIMWKERHGALHWVSVFYV